MTGRRLEAGLVAATVLLGVATVGLASLPPRPVWSALTVVYTLSFRVATDWLVVVALLAVAERYVSAPGLTGRRLRGLTALVFLGGLAIEVSPFVHLVVDPAPVATDRLVRGLVAAGQRTLYPTGLFVATMLGAARARAALADRSEPDEAGGLPLSPSPGRWPALAPAAVWTALRVLAVVGVAAFAVETGARLALGAPHAWFVVVEASVGALANVADYAVLTVAFLVLAVEGARVRTLVGGTAAVWAGAFGLSLVVTVVGALAAVGLVGVTTTPMAAVDASSLGTWPAPHSWATLLRVATFVAGGVGLLAVQRARDQRGPTAEDASAAGDAPGDASPERR